MSRKSWDGVELVAALRTGAERLHARVAEVNALNVFPVPDGDTGTNMLATLRAAVAEGEAALATGVTAIDVVSEAVARGALLGARGNSGVLLSQIHRGLPHAVRGRRPRATRAREDHRPPRPVGADAGSARATISTASATRTATARYCRPAFV